MNLIFSGCKYSWKNSLHIYSLPPDAAFLEKFHQSRLLSVLQNGLFLQNNRQSKEQEHKDHPNVGQSLRDYDILRRNRGSSLSIIARTLYSTFDIPVQESEHPEHLYVYKKVKKYVQLTPAHSHDYSKSLTLHNKFSFHRQGLIPHFVFLQHVP